MLSGMTAFVTLTDETEKVDKGDIRDAFKPRGLKLERVKKREIATPVETWMIKVKGGT